MVFEKNYYTYFNIFVNEFKEREVVKMEFILFGLAVILYAVLLGLIFILVTLFSD